MRIEILGTESLGVRGLCCSVRTRRAHIVMDPGLALGYRRKGLLPHPLQVAAGETVARAIVQHLATATDVVISHFHGDHIPLANANPFQLPLAEIAPLLRRPRLWGKDTLDEPAGFAARSRDIMTAAGQPIRRSQGRRETWLAFSEAMPHGAWDSGLGKVMMTRIEDEGEVFVHAADIQLLADAPVSVILDWQPTVLLVSGPPLYRRLHPAKIKAATRRVLRLARSIPCCIIDHHALRCGTGFKWLDQLRRETGGAVCCAADYMGVERQPWEAERSRLYADHPVAPDWHATYQRRPLKIPEQPSGHTDNFSSEKYHCTNNLNKKTSEHL